MIVLQDAQTIALDFLIEEWGLSESDRTWFTVLDARPIPDSWWYIVEIGLKNRPDKWIFQVFDDGECDPCYTFISPFTNSEINAQLTGLPPAIAIALQKERRGHI